MRALLLTLALAVSGLSSCIIVTDECDSGDTRCVDDVAEECSGGDWVVFMDCYDCAGYCDFDAYGNAACFCP